MNASRIVLPPATRTSTATPAACCGMVAMPAVFLPWGMVMQQMQHIYAAACTQARLDAARDHFARVTSVSNN